MQTKTIQPIQVLYFETQTALNTISKHVRVVARQLYQEAIAKNLEVTGPIYWIYEGADGNPETIFKLTIALPVSRFDGVLESAFSTKTLDTFECVTEQLAGEWSNLGATYNSVIGNIMSQNLRMSGQNREIYINMDFENPERNITEVQVGILH